MANAADYKTLSGYISDRSTGEPLIGAAVMSGNGGVVSNSYGHYSLRVPAGKINIKIQYVGYVSIQETIDILNDTVLNFSLSSDNTLEASVVSEKAEAGVRSRFAGAISLPTELITTAPVLAGEADVIKTLQLMPGIQSGREGFSGIYVRGGDQDENMFLLDGVSIYNVNHMFGLFSAFAPEAVKQVSIFTGAFPAKFGGRTSSIIDIRTNDGDTRKIKGSVTLGMLNERFHLEGPLYKQKTTFSVSARGTHTFLVSPVLNLSKAKFNYWFYDLNAKLTHRFSDSQSIYFSFFNSEDHMKYEDNTVSTEEFKDMNRKIELEDKNSSFNGNLLGILKWKGSFGNGLFMNSAVYFNRYRFQLENNSFSAISTSTGNQNNQPSFRSESQRIMKNNSGIRDYGYYLNAEYNVSNNLRLQSGAEAISHVYSPDSHLFISDLGSFVPKKNETIGGMEASVYANASLSIVDRLFADAGARYTYFNVRKTPFHSFQPRLSLKYDFNRRYSIRLAYSRLSQYVHLLHNDYYNFPTDLWVPVTDRIPPQISDIWSAGATYADNSWEFSVEPYYKKLYNNIDFIDGHLLFNTFTNWEENVAVGEGRSFGADFWLRKTTGKTRGFIKYSISKSERRYPDGSVNAGKWFPFSYDRPHYLNINLSHRFNDRFDVSATWSLASGNLMTVPTSVAIIVFQQREPDDEMGYKYMKKNVSLSEAYPQKNNYRLSPTHHLDVNATYRSTYKNGTEGIWALGVYNLYNAKNPQFYNVAYKENSKNWEEGAISSDYEIFTSTVLVVMPTLSYTYKF